MRTSFAVLLATVLAIPALAAVNGPCSGGHAGVCVLTSSCASSGGVYINGACPNDPSNVKCCTKSPCYQGLGSCKFTPDCKSPAFTGISGYCPGGSNFKCCIPSGCVVCAAGEARDLKARVPCC